jgi:hypothetical protein
MAVIKVKPWGEGQGDHVLIDEQDFIEGFHEKIGQRGRPPKEEEGGKDKKDKKEGEPKV